MSQIPYILAAIDEQYILFKNFLVADTFIYQRQ